MTDNQTSGLSPDQREHIRTVVQATLQRVLENTSRSRQSFEDDDLLFVELGLDSLDLAQVVVMLERELGVDPFRTAGVRVRSFGDLVQAYVGAFDGSP